MLVRVVLIIISDLGESIDKINEQIKSLESKLSLTQQIAGTLQVSNKNVKVRYN